MNNFDWLNVHGLLFRLYDVANTNVKVNVKYLVVDLFTCGQTYLHYNGLFSHIKRIAKARGISISSKDKIPLIRYVIDELSKLDMIGDLPEGCLYNKYSIYINGKLHNKKSWRLIPLKGEHFLDTEERKTGYLLDIERVEKV